MSQPLSRLCPSCKLPCRVAFWAEGIVLKLAHQVLRMWGGSILVNLQEHIDFISFELRIILGTQEEAEMRPCWFFRDPASQQLLYHNTTACFPVCIGKRWEPAEFVLSVSRWRQWAQPLQTEKWARGRHNGVMKPTIACWDRGFVDTIPDCCLYLYCLGLPLMFAKSLLMLKKVFLSWWRK